MGGRISPRRLVYICVCVCVCVCVCACVCLRWVQNLFGEGLCGEEQQELAVLKWGEVG